MRNGRLTRHGGASSAMRMLERALDERRYGWFGCVAHGLHADDTEASACLRCALQPNESAADATAFTDDRGDLTTAWGQSAGEQWVHTRWLDPFGRLHRDDGDKPALEAEDLEMWAVGGRIRRAAGPSIVAADGSWAYTNDAGYFHRDGDKPSITWGGVVHHVVNGVLHRPVGAALYGRHFPEYWLDGRQTTRDALWAHYLEPYGVAEDNTGAQKYLADALERSDAPADAFPEVDQLTVSVALAMYRS